MIKMDTVTVGDILKPARTSVNIEPAAEYVAIGIKSFGKGIFHYPPTLGANLGKLRFFRFPTGALAFSNIQAWEGAIGVTSEADAIAVASNRFLFYVPVDKDRVDVRYIYHYFLGEPGLAAIRGASPGSAKRNRTLGIERLERIRLPLPPIEEQRRIVDLVETVDKVIEKARTCLDKLTTLRSQLVDSIRANGKAVLLSDVAVVSQGRSLPIEHQGKQAGEVSWFKISDMSTPENLFGYRRAATRMTMHDIKQKGGQVLPVGAVVFPRVGGSILTENKRIVDVECAVDENHLVVSPNSETNPEFLLGAIESLRLSSLVQTGAVPSLNMGLIRSVRLPWTTGEHQNALGDVLGVTRKQGATQTAYLRRLEALRSELLTALLAGEHQILESYDDLLGA
ncbi:restriction endonuclease subunit S [Micromonospora carbonacea]|uniref:Type I restriction enzyme, S subunit n=1 Tax=Micromonospora carbonacea TaxID=47853 RepID=A0A1C4V6F3_9ACTN|nr:restriction endonuclease subunit S [Micromonospora carbonacea]SCE79593.1 type I restriction enzyme, S subunit [Micromonospora carbonacea]